MNKSSTISGYEMVAIQMLYLFASAGFIYPSIILRSTLGSCWIPVAVWACAALLSSWLYRSLLSRLNGERLIARLRQAAGFGWTVILCLPVLLFLAGATGIVLRAYSEIITMTMLPTTPISFLNGMLLAPAALALAGMMPIVRTARVFFMLSILMTLLLMLVGLSDVHWALGKPWLRTDGDFLLNKRFYAGSYLWMGFVITSLIGPYSAGTVRRVWKSYALAIVCGFPLVLAYIYLPILTFGVELNRHLTFPFVSKMDSIYHYWIAVENLAAVFVSVTMFYVLILMALKLHALGETFKALAPRVPSGVIYAGLVVVVYTFATVLSSWRALEDVVLYTAGVRLYTLFGFPLLGIAILAAGKKRQTKKNGV